MGIPHHGNLGDNAIALAEEKIIETYFSEYEKYVVPEKRLEQCAERLKGYVHDEDILLLHGGGNIGDTYVTPEAGRRKTIQTYPNNKIIIFPQTAYYSDTPEGKEVLEESKKIYNAHKNLVILAREEKSYNFMKKEFYNAKVYLTPDIVMTLKETKNLERNGALLLFRTDKEKTMKDETIEEIKEKMVQNYAKYTLSDMNIWNTITNNISYKEREKLLEDKFEQLQSSKIVITDRLHGMIFSAITETPCIVFNNFNHKIEESYKWLKNLEYIKFCNNINELDKKIEEINQVKNIKYDNQFALDIIVPILEKEIDTI